MAISSLLESLVNDPRFFSQVDSQYTTSTARVKSKRANYVQTAASSVLGSDFEFNPSNTVSDDEFTGLAIYDELSKILPYRSTQSMFFWHKLGRPFASMLEAAEFPISLQIFFLTFVYARVLGMMGPLEPNGPASYMTFDGSPVELSWTTPSNTKSRDDNTCRQVRFAIEPMPLRSLLMILDPTLIKSLNMMISYAEESSIHFKPRFQILSMDCVPNKANRLKMYCRPSRGTSWHDARHAFTLAGRLDSPKMCHVLSRLETLWNLLFPFAHSRSNRDLDEGLKFRHADRDDTRPRRSADHPAGGLLYYYSLVPGSTMILPKVYLPVSRYCANDLVIAEALEKFHAIDGRHHDHGWVAKEVSAA
ncbi:hypothetical protein C0993_009030 [Termitomyces sp. T159_Od127]|nr:hypothetical protein C0993_009030 [Termitomyces sp. T159_Od127]